MLIYDTEIVEAIPSKKEPIIPGIKYCKGWGDHAGMGISCICAYDYKTDRYRVFTESNKDQFADLIKKHVLLIGFNNINFDNKVIKATWDIDIEPRECYDILEKIKKVVGTFSVCSLDAYCKANFNQGKAGYGRHAPVEWQQGKIGNVIDYCLEDVRLTKKLFDTIQRDGSVIDPKNKAIRISVEKSPWK